MVPGNVVEYCCGPFFCVHQVFTGVSFHEALSQKVATATGIAASPNNEEAFGGREGKLNGKGKARRACIGSSATFIAHFVEAVRVRDHRSGVRVVVLVGLDMDLVDRGGEGGQDMECFISDIEVCLESSFQTSKRWVRESADDCVVVNVGLDGGGCDVIVAETKPADESAINIKTRQVAKAFDAGCIGILKFVDGMANDGGSGFCARM
jgi:hypothetical protein